MITLGLPFVGGILSSFGYIIHLTVFLFIEWVYPRDSIEIAEEYDYDAYRSDPSSYGNHKFEVSKAGTETNDRGVMKRYKIALDMNHKHKAKPFNIAGPTPDKSQKNEKKERIEINPLLAELLAETKENELSDY